MVEPNLNSARGAQKRRLMLYVLLAAICVLILAIFPPFTSAYIQSMIIKFLIFGIFAISLNLLYGWTGLFSLGHAAYFGTGAYAAAILIVRYGIKSFWLVAPAGILMATIIAAIFGFIALRVSGTYFLLITLALGQLLWSFAIKFYDLTGGAHGIVGMGLPDLSLPGFTMTNTYFYYLVFIFFIICLFLMYRLEKSPFGYALQGIRDDERRMQGLGYNTWLFKYIAFVVAGLFAGVAGVLFQYFYGIAAPEHFNVITSTLVMLMVIVGSADIVFGPIVGALIIVPLQHFSAIFLPERWPLIVGGVFVIFVMFLRDGISIYVLRLLKKVGFGYRSNKN